MDARVNTADDPSTSRKHLVNSGPVTPELISTRVGTLLWTPGLMFTKLSANIERLVGFIIVYSNCDAAMVTD